MRDNMLLHDDTRRSFDLFQHDGSLDHLPRTNIENLLLKFLIIESAARHWHVTCKFHTSLGKSKLMLEHYWRIVGHKAGPCFKHIHIITPYLADDAICNCHFHSEHVEHGKCVTCCIQACFVAARHILHYVLSSLLGSRFRNAVNCCHGQISRNLRCGWARVDRSWRSICMPSRRRRWMCRLISSRYTIQMGVEIAWCTAV